MIRAGIKPGTGHMARFEKIASPSNPLLKQVRKAVQRGGLTSGGYCIAETFHLVVEALRSGCRVEAVLVAYSALQQMRRMVPLPDSVRVLALPDGLFASIAATESSQGVMALVHPRVWTMETILSRHLPVLILDGVQDPGNAGAIVRASEAFGAAGVVFLKGTANPFNPKAVRASAGSVFRLPLVCGVAVEEALAQLQRNEYRIYAACPDADLSLEAADMDNGCAVVIGSEGRGVSDAWRAAGSAIRIPMTNVESLNAAIAAAIFLYEASRRRTT